MKINPLGYLPDGDREDAPCPDREARPGAAKNIQRTAIFTASIHQ